MLRGLRIANFAIIDAMELAFAPGMNVLTGETGAGKSIITRAIGLLCGGRATSDLIRSDCDEAEIEGLFELETGDRELLPQWGLPADDEVVVRRVLARSGKGKIYINGSVSSATMLAQLGERLIHIYGQHEHALLLRPESHLGLLDDFGKLAALRASMADAFRLYRDAADQLERLTRNRESLQQRIDLLTFQIDELGKAGLRRGEEAELRQERERQRHAERLQQVCHQGEEALYSGDGAIAGVLGKVLVQVQEAARIDSGFAASLATLQQAAAEIDDAARELRRLGERIERDPQRLEEIEDRLALIARLKRKYDCDADVLVDRLAALEQELEQIAGATSDPEALRAEVDRRSLVAWRVATELSAARRRSATELEQQTAAELATLGMAGTRFQVHFDASASDERDDRRLSPEGADTVEFHLSANVGEEPRPLARVASGGELSRIMLALKALTAGAGEVSTLVFDEVDTGIGGTVAEAVARRLHRLARSRQILSITHLPQIAAFADHHLAIEKRVERGRTRSSARALHGDERVMEISRMLGAAASEESLRYARRLIAEQQTN